jgi:hypothetical protein
MACERVAFIGRAREQISHHKRDGITEAWVESIVLNADKSDKEYQPDGSFKITVRTKKPTGVKITVNIYAREEVFKIDDRIVWQTCKVFGIHVEG